MLRILQGGGIQDVRAQPQRSGHFLCDGDLIPRNHLEFHAHLPGVVDRCFGVRPRRIGHGQHAGKHPLAFLICPGHAQGTEAAAREFVDGFLDGGLYLREVGRHRQNYLRRILWSL